MRSLSGLAMLRRAFLPASRPSTQLFRSPHARRYATEQLASQTRIERFNRRLPRFLHKYTNALGNAPLTHITAFLLLHEITAIIPLLGLAATFHYTHWLPSWFSEGAWVLQSVERFGRYFRRKGWIREGDASEADREVRLEMRTRDKAWNISEGGVRVVVEFATAYAITKMLLPLRIVLSVWGTPWFATRTVVPMTGWFKRVLGRKKASPAVPGSGSSAAGTGALDAGAVAKGVKGKGP